MNSAGGRTLSHIRALVRRGGLRVRTGDADLFGIDVQELTFPVELETALRPQFAVWALLAAQLAVTNAEFVKTPATNPVVQRLPTAPGVAPSSPRHRTG